jgi:hypothetical protein
MPERVTHIDLRSELAAFRAMTETELRNITTRLEAVEATQANLVNVATSGRASLKTLLWVGGAISGLLALAAAFWRNAGGG